MQGGEGKASGRAPAAGGAWALLPASWCAWLLVWLIPALLVAPHLETPRLWLTLDTAPTAVVVAAAFFLIAVWPFWPALACRASNAGGWVALSVLEVVILLALAIPFGMVAWSVADRALDVGPTVATAAGLAVLGLGLRIAAGGLGPGAARWLMLVAVLIMVGPLLVAYAAGETAHAALERAAEASPVTAAVHLALTGWPDEAWAWFVRITMWPTVGVILGILGFWNSARRVGR